MIKVIHPPRCFRLTTSVIVKMSTKSSWRFPNIHNQQNEKLHKHNCTAPHDTMLTSRLKSLLHSSKAFKRYRVNEIKFPFERCLSSKSEKPEPISSSASSDAYDGIDSYTRKEMEKRHKGIIMNPLGLAKEILPNNYVVKTNQKTGAKKMIAVERSLGYFWYVKDLKDTNNKAVIANEELISIEDAQVFPPLNELKDSSLQTLNGEVVSLPDFFIRDNRSRDPSAYCTLLAVSFNEYGNRMLPSWTEPIMQVFRNDPHRVRVNWLSCNEGTTLKLLKYFILRGFNKSIPDERKDKVLLYFGSCPELRDVLRMHNDKTGYIFLLDGLGRVRFAGSGQAENYELKLLIKHVKEITPGLKTPKT